LQDHEGVSGSRVDQFLGGATPWWATQSGAALFQPVSHLHVFFLKPKISSALFALAIALANLSRIILHACHLFFRSLAQKITTVLLGTNDAIASGITSMAYWKTPQAFGNAYAAVLERIFADAPVGAASLCHICVA
jgi:hypothetical protein